MHIQRLVALVAAMLMALSLAPAALAQPVDTPRGAPESGQPFGREPHERGQSANAPGRVEEPEPAPTLPGQPRNDVIADVEVVPDDASIPRDLIPYHEIPAKLRELQASDRISVEVIGQSTQGRDLHLVVATSPMSDGDWAEWQRLSDLRTDDPHAAIAAFEAGEYDAWKSPLLVNNNIHGNEWEGTDASLQALERLASSDAPEVVELLDEHVIAFVITNNPDGRVAGTRANANGFDMNRDYITQSQPEVRAVRDQLIRYNPLTMLDQHGYTGTTLIEPTTGPHGDNYEYDLYIRNALRNALAMEEAVLALGEPGVDAVNIPYRNRTSGWDDWPPIFTPMYSIYHGTIGHTVEFPFNPRRQSEMAEWPELSRINTAVSRATIEANFEWANANRETLLADQLEVFRRGVDGDAQRPIDDELALSLAAGDNAKTVQQEFPRAYVIPVGEGQRSDTAAARTVQFLLDNDVRVERASRPFNLDGQHYPAGSYVVDMHQAKRGLANTILEVGRDVTQDYPTMYDISGWSHGLLWGATVERVAEGTLEGAPLQQISEAAPTGSVQPGRRPLYGLEVDSVADIQAVNHLLDEGVALTRTDDGTFVVPGSALSAVREVAESHGVQFTNVTPAQARDAAPVAQLRIGTSASSDEVFALTRLGFDLTAVDDEGFNAGDYSFDDFDAFYVSRGSFDPLELDEAQSAAFAQWLADGGTVVGRGGNGIEFNDSAGLLEVTAASGHRRASGVVAVDNNPDSPITGDALPSSFVSSPYYFTSVGEDVRVDQHLQGEGFFLAGHWSDQDEAAGHAVVVSGTARGANVTLFGTEPLYRAHPEGLHEQVAEALWWSGS